MYLSFIDDQNLITATKKVVEKIKNARNRPDSQLFKNVVDPFSGLFDAALQEIDIEDWLSQEKSRQIQKTFQNAIGEFHQEIVGSIPGWENLTVGNLMDVRNQEKKIVAEIKNKHNTTKGDHRVRVYDDIQYALNSPQNNGFVGYMVEILPLNKKRYDKPFIVSDNTTHTRRPTNENIRLISGQLFYTLATGNDNALKELYMVLPFVISDITGVPRRNSISPISLEYLFDKAY